MKFFISQKTKKTCKNMRTKLKLLVILCLFASVLSQNNGAPHKAETNEEEEEDTDAFLKKLDKDMKDIEVTLNSIKEGNKLKGG